MKYRLRIEMETELAAAQFFGDGTGATADEVECARQVADYIFEKGMRAFLSDWNVDDFDIWVGNYPAVRAGHPVVGTAVSNQDSEPHSS